MSQIYVDQKKETYVNHITSSEHGDGHHYTVNQETKRNNVDFFICKIDFQEGPINKHGVNGVQNEHLLAILIHRTKALNAKYPCRENAIAITKMEEALMWFEKRTSDRINRGVEGENKK